MAGRGERGPDIASVIRGAFIRAVKAREDNAPTHKKPPLSTVMDGLIDENPIGLLNAIKGFVPKEIDVTATERPYEDWLEEIAGDPKED
jgi:hypothetical protein